MCDWWIEDLLGIITVANIRIYIQQKYWWQFYMDEGKIAIIFADDILL